MVYLFELAWPSLGLQVLCDAALDGARLPHMFPCRFYPFTPWVVFFPARVRMPDMYGAQLVSLDMAAEVLGVLQAHAQWLAEAKYWLHLHALCS